jgi:hypothetical protein
MLRYFKIYFYINLHAGKLFRKQKIVDYFVIVGVVVRRNDRYETAVKGNNSGGWSSDGVVLWLEMR